MNRLTEVAEQPLHRALGLTDWEAARIRELMGRDPNHFELAVFSLLWSEHCGYKHSALLLKRLPSSGEGVLQGPGENAGVIDLGEGEAIAFKVESHNHPSAVEPFQSGAGNLVVLYGATTGRDGIGGASVLASAELGEDDPDKRPTVQVGDPFTGKKLIEVSLELVERGLVESLQDCGAAGLASALSEMATECGLDVRLDRVPLREEAMEPWEIMISESQERMVAVVHPGMLEGVEEVCTRWELACAVIGEVTDSRALRCFHEGDVVGDVPAAFLTDECPRYELERDRSPG